MPATRKREETRTWTAGVAAVLRGGALGTVCALAAVGVAAALCNFAVVPVRAGEYASIAAALMGSFVAGAYGARHRTSSPGVWIGAASGTVVFLLLLTLGALIYRTAPDTTGSAARMAECLCGGALAGLLFAKPKKKRRR